MKRLAALALTVGAFGYGGRGAAAEPPAPGGAPAARRLPDYGGNWRKIESDTASGPVVVPAVPAVSPSPRLFPRASAPAAFEPSPPVMLHQGPRLSAEVTQAGHHSKEPVPVPPGYVPNPGGGVVAGGCTDGSCGGAGRTCWQRFTDWLCFRQTPVKLGLHPIPYPAPLYTYFPCVSKPGCAAPGCAGPNCAGSVAGRVNGGPLGRPWFGPNHADGMAGNGDPGIGGYRIAAPENPAVAGPPGPPPVSTNSTSYRQPLRP